jgi:hypothetical protein
MDKENKENKEDKENMEDNENVVGDCGVCGITLPAGANHAYTACKHLFCISCLLKWHIVNPTCPMCRRPLYDESDGAQGAQDAQDASQLSNTIIEEMDFNMDEEIMHDHMMGVVDINAINHCRRDQTQMFTGNIHLCIIPKEEGNHSYERIEVGIANPHAHYILELIDTARAFRYRFGRIERIITHHLNSDVKWYAFRERVDYIDEERAQIVTEWAIQIQHILINNVRVLRHYSPEIHYNI